MNKITKYSLISLGLNAIFAVLLFIPVFFVGNGPYDGLAWLLIALGIFALSLVVQLLVGLVFAIGEKRKEVGKAMLISAGVILLIGFSICTPMLFRF